MLKKVEVKIEEHKKWLVGKKYTSFRRLEGKLITSFFMKEYLSHSKYIKLNKKFKFIKIISFSGGLGIGPNPDYKFKGIIYIINFQK